MYSRINNVKHLPPKIPKSQFPITSQVTYSSPINNSDYRAGVLNVVIIYHLPVSTKKAPHIACQKELASNTTQHAYLSISRYLILDY